MLEIIGTRPVGSPPREIESKVWDALAQKIYNVAMVQKPGLEFIAELKAVLSSTPPETQQRWSEVLRRRIVEDRRPATCVQCQCKSRLNLILDPDRADVCSHCSAITATPLEMLADPLLYANERLQRTGLVRGDDCQARLDERFSRLCDVARHVVIVDRFALSDASRAENRTAGSSGLKKFLKLANDGGVSSVQLHVAEGAEINRVVMRAGDIPGVLRSLVAPLGLSLSIEVVVQSKRDGQEKIHDRSLAFTWPSGGVSWFLGKGLAQFDGPRVTQDHDLGRKSHRQMMQLVSRLPSSAQLQVRVT
ncbi:hypothetical protein [Cellulomonas sp. Leaf334]|uniref:hypothetical protein n=1 Tax=Cellulomonas sp. Leaf334 TaxID=1736339 RepID=UPI000B0E012C|nr:hypothetical protein [Cellulomonas sp. Leaf334]